MDLKSFIRDIPDFPKPGILFRDITPVLKSPEAMRYVEEQFVEAFRGTEPTAVAGIESRGFIFGILLARSLGLPFLPIRKEGKLPWTRLSETYALEYGEGVLEIHEDAVGPEDRVLILDDLLATGGTARASVRLIERLGATVAGIGFVVGLSFLEGEAKLPGQKIVTLIHYDD